MRYNSPMVLLAAACTGPVLVDGAEPAPVDPVERLAGVDDTDTGEDTGSDGPGTLYDPDHIVQIALTLSDDSVRSLDSDPFGWVPGDLVIDGTALPDVGVRLKGEYNLRDLDGKAAFKIKLDQYVEGQHYDGVPALTLNNYIEDPSFVAERLVYQAFRAAGLPASRANSAQLTVNGESFGIYLNLENVGRDFLEGWFTSPDGNLYEEIGYDFSPGHADDFEQEQGEDHSHADLSALIAAVDAASPDTFEADLAPVLDVPRFLRYCAMEGIVNQWDGYCYTRFGPNNFRVYDDTGTGQFSLLPAGMDMAMKGLETYWMPLAEPEGLLLQRCFASVPCYADYLDAIAEMAAVFDGEDLPGRADAIYAQIHQAVLDDPRKECTDAEFERTFEDVRQFAEQRTQNLDVGQGLRPLD